jgi:hypothetical protein
MERAGLIGPLGIEHEEVFMVGEVLARLRINDPHAVYGMVKDGVLRPYDGFDTNKRGRNPGQKTLITFDSFANYLDEDIPQMFYNTRQLLEEVRHMIPDGTKDPMNWMQKQLQRAQGYRKRHGMEPLGRKINPYRRSGYLFNLGDICEFHEYCSLPRAAKL